MRRTRLVIPMLLIVLISNGCCWQACWRPGWRFQDCCGRRLCAPDCGPVGCAASPIFDGGPIMGMGPGPGCATCQGGPMMGMPMGPIAATPVAYQPPLVTSPTPIPLPAPTPMPVASPR